jgi:hypothetical protein
MIQQSFRRGVSAGACRRHDDVQDVFDRKIGAGLLDLSGVFPFEDEDPAGYTVSSFIGAPA